MKLMELCPNWTSTKNKFILVDFGYYSFTAIYKHLILRDVPPTYISLNMLITTLKQVGINENDTVIVAVDSSKGSWRKDVDSAYKADRKFKREQVDIDWIKVFSQFQILLNWFKTNTPFHVIEIDKLEADDIIATISKKYQDTKCVILSTDSDFEQLSVFKNVVLFSPASKRYKEILNPYMILAKKIKRERTDNLISPILTQQDYDKRKLLVNLTTLPDFITQAVEPHLHFEKKEWNFDKIMYPSLIERIKKMYNQSVYIPKTKKRTSENHQLTF